MFIKKNKYTKISFITAWLMMIYVIVCFIPLVHIIPFNIISFGASFAVGVWLFSDD